MLVSVDDDQQTLVPYLLPLSGRFSDIEAVSPGVDELATVGACVPLSRDMVLRILRLAAVSGSRPCLDSPVASGSAGFRRFGNSSGEVSPWNLTVQTPFLGLSSRRDSFAAPREQGAGLPAFPEAAASSRPKNLGRLGRNDLIFMPCHTEVVHIGAG